MAVWAMAVAPGPSSPTPTGPTPPPDYRGRFAEFEELLMALCHFSAFWLSHTGGSGKDLANRP